MTAPDAVSNRRAKRPYRVTSARVDASRRARARTVIRDGFARWRSLLNFIFLLQDIFQKLFSRPTFWVSARSRTCTIAAVPATGINKLRNGT